MNEGLVSQDQFKLEVQQNIKHFLGNLINLSKIGTMKGKFFYLPYFIFPYALANYGNLIIIHLKDVECYKHTRLMGYSFCCNLYFYNDLIFIFIPTTSSTSLACFSFNKIILLKSQI